jgi:hypothetical protein
VASLIDRAIADEPSDPALTARPLRVTRGDGTVTNEQEATRIVRSALEPKSVRPESPVEANWHEAGQAGVHKAMQALSERYAWPWTVVDLDAGLRGELADTFFRHILDSVTSESGEPSDATRVELRRLAEDMAKGMRVRAALLPEATEVKEAGIGEPRASEMLVAAVSAEMGVAPDEAVRLTEAALGS